MPQRSVVEANLQALVARAGSTEKTSEQCGLPIKHFNLSVACATHKLLSCPSPLVVDDMLLSFGCLACPLSVGETSWLAICLCHKP